MKGVMKCAILKDIKGISGLPEEKEHYACHTEGGTMDAVLD